MKTICGSARSKEVVDEFQPDILWQDFDLNLVDPTHLLESLQYYYNAALGWGKDVVATYKDGYNNQGEVYDYERGGPADITTPYWLTDDAIGVSSWCYTQGMAYYSPEAVLDAFIDRVSKGGNLLLNISPMWDGTIPEEQLTILSTLGTFLKQNGTAIYNTRAWTVYGEGPTKMGGGSFTNPTAGTASDVRYTKAKDGSMLYAIWMGWPGNGKEVTMASVTPAAFPVGGGKVYLFGPTGGAAIALTFTQDGSGLHVTLPSTQPYTAVAYAMAISPSGAEPAPTPWLGDNPDGGVSGGGGIGDGGVGAGGAGDASAGGAGGSAGTGGRTGTGGAAGAYAGSSSNGGNAAGGAGGAALTGGGASGGGGLRAARVLPRGAGGEGRYRRRRGQRRRCWGVGLRGQVGWCGRVWLGGSDGAVDRKRHGGEWLLVCGEGSGRSSGGSAVLLMGLLTALVRRMRPRRKI